jgi:hypothetical protein
MPFFLLTGCPLQGKTVHIPPSISVSTIGLRITGCSWKAAGLLAHGVQKLPVSPTGTSANLAVESAQYGCDGYNIWYLRLQASLVNNF